MTNEQELHLSEIKRQFAIDVDAKYRKGAAEHGGELLDYSIDQLLDMMMEEAVDLYTYGHAAKEKLRQQRLLRLAQVVAGE